MLLAVSIITVVGVDFSVNFGAAVLVIILGIPAFTLAYVMIRY